MRSLALLLLSLGLPACDKTEPSRDRYELQFDAIDDRGNAIAGATVAIGETKIGTTGKTGILRAEVNASKGERFPLHVSCPKDYAKAEAPAQIAFRDTAGQEHPRIHVGIACARALRVAALLVHADGRADMPILVDGIEHARTGPGGYAHLRLDMPPGSQFQVVIDSSAHPSLRPVDPTKTMTLGDENEVFVFDPVFSEGP